MKMGGWKTGVNGSMKGLMRIKMMWIIRFQSSSDLRDQCQGALMLLWRLTPFSRTLCRPLIYHPSIYSASVWIMQSVHAFMLSVSIKPLTYVTLLIHLLWKTHFLSTSHQIITFFLAWNLLSKSAAHWEHIANIKLSGRFFHYREQYVLDLWQQ